MSKLLLVAKQRKKDEYEKMEITPLVIFLLIVSISVISIKYINLSEEYNRKSRIADDALRSTLNRAVTGFAVDFSSITYDHKQYSYYETMSNLATASSLVEFSTYNENNDILYVALYNLYKLMEEKIYMNKIIEKSTVIRDNLFKL